MNQRPRVIPCLGFYDKGLYKTIKFKNPNYLGDPINAVKIFNEKEVDELCLIDIRASYDKREPDFELLHDIATEAFMPLSYGGGIVSISQAKRIFSIGYEKVIFNTCFAEDLELIKEAVKIFGGQSIIVSIDVRTSILGKKKCYIVSGEKEVRGTPVQLAQMAESIGVGEILLQSIDNDGVMKGYDIDLIKTITRAVSIPVIACGGAGRLSDIYDAIYEGKADAVAAGSLFVYFGKKKGILINYPTEEELKKAGIYQ